MADKSYNMNIDTGEKTWLTPPHIINALGPFDLDPCCPPTMPWRTAAQMVCRPDDGLAVDWAGKRVWLNPPYGREAVPFLRKMAENKTGGGCLSIVHAHRHRRMARLDIPLRLRLSVSARSRQILQARRSASRLASRALCAHCVLGTGFYPPARERPQRGVFARV